MCIKIPPEIEAGGSAPPPAASCASNGGIEAPIARAQRTPAHGNTGFAFASLGCLWCLAFVICAIWQVAAIVSRVAGTELAPGSLIPAEMGVAALPLTSAQQGAPSRVEVAKAPTPALPEPTLVTEVVDTSTFEANAEASEMAIPMGLRAGFDSEVEPFPLGVVPPATSPRVSCADVFVYIVTVAEGAPMSSTASLGIGKNGPARFRRPGQRIGDWTVLTISDDWTGLNPNVWLERDGAVCKAKLAGNPSRAHAALSAPPRLAVTKERRRRQRRAR
jgi:hypothetical protein